MAGKKLDVECRRCKPFGRAGYRLDRDVDRDHPYPRIVVCECVQPLCTCGALWEADTVPGPAYEQMSERADSATSETECPCWPVRQRVERINRLLDRSGVDQRGTTFADVKTSVGSRKLTETERAKNAAISYVEHNDARSGMYLYGTTGNGKTYLASALLNELIIQTARPGLFVNVPQQLFLRLRQTYEDNRAETEMQVLNQLTRIPFLVLDDLGVERNTTWESEVLYNLIDARYRKRRSLIVTSNLPLDEFKPLSRGRIASRISHMCASYKMPDEDLRPLFNYVVQ